jgi:hypothetical protein
MCISSEKLVSGLPCLRHEPDRKHGVLMRMHAEQ